MAITRLTRTIAAEIAANAVTHGTEHEDIQTAINATIGTGVVVWDPFAEQWLDSSDTAVFTAPVAPTHCVGGIEPPPWFRTIDSWTAGRLTDGAVILHEDWSSDDWPSTRWESVDAESTATGGVGTLASPATTSAANAHNTVSDLLSDYQLYTEFTLRTGFDQANSTTIEWYLRRSGGDYYLLNMFPTTGTLQIRRYDNSVLNGSTEQLNKETAFLPGRAMRMLLRHEGNDLYIKHWWSTEAMPDYWPITWEDDQASPHTVGSLWMRLDNGSTEADSNAVDFTAFTITDHTVVTP